MPVDNIAAYVADDDAGGADGPAEEASEPPAEKESEKRAAGKALIAAIKSGDGLAVCEAVKAITDEPY